MRLVAPAVRRISRCYATKTEQVTSVASKFGRPSNNLSSGIVGLANVGKSTIFQAITRSKAGNPANYPFATIKPEEARVIVPSNKLDHLHELYGSQDKIPATLKIIDIAGLVRGASTGAGLGNQFLSDIRQVDGIFQVVRSFVDQEITHVEGSVDPVRDLTVVMDELLLKDMEFVENAIAKLEKNLKKNIKTPAMAAMDFEKTVLEKCYEWLMEGQRIANNPTWTDEEIQVLNSHHFLTTKPTVYLVNVSEEDFQRKNNEKLADIEKWVEEFSPSSPILLISASHETQLAEAEEVSDSVLPEAVYEMRHALNLISFYTCGEKETRQWTLRKGNTAPEAAGVIHTDLQKTFLNANVIHYEDVANMVPPLDEKTLVKGGKQHRVGKNYVVEDGDIILFKATGAKKKT